MLDLTTFHQPAACPVWCVLPRSVLTDDSLCVKGSNGSIFAVGDASTIDQPKVRGALCSKAQMYA